MQRIPTHQQLWKSRQAMLAAIALQIGIRADAEDPIISGYRTRQEDLVQRNTEILAQADQAGRELSTEESATIRDNVAEVERLEGQITLRMQVVQQDDRLRQPQARRTDPNAAEPAGDAAATTRHQAAGQRAEPHIQTTQISTAATRAAARGNGGFHNVGAWAQAVRAACLQPGNMDGRLRAALTTYGSEGVGADGGFAVPADFRATIADLAMTSEESLFSRCDSTPTASNSVSLVADETTPWSTAGVRVYTRAEAAAMAQSKPSLRDLSVKLHEIYAFVPMTDELLEDAPLLSNHLTNKAGEAFQFALNNYIINGTGVGQMLGILNSPCLVTVNEESSQTDDTVHADNIVKMWSRMPANVRGRAVWLINQDVEPELMKLGAVVKSASGTAVGGMPVYMPPGGLSASPYATLLGRPVIATEACSALGDAGDIIFAYMGGYFAPFKSGGIKSDVSMHLYFDQGVTAFRWTMRVGGQPWLSTPIARRGSNTNTLSHFVTLQAR